MTGLSEFLVRFAVGFVFTMLVAGIVGWVWFLGMRRWYSSGVPSVRVGDIWESVDSNPWNQGVFVVLAPNRSVEAGRDSWVMERVFPSSAGWLRARGGRERIIKYMHHNSRMRGEWRLVETDSSVLDRCESAADCSVRGLLWSSEETCLPAEAQRRGCRHYRSGRAVESERRH